MFENDVSPYMSSNPVQQSYYVKYVHFYNIIFIIITKKGMLQTQLTQWNV